jgi:RND family efflux transporter MFP subunit
VVERLMPQTHFEQAQTEPAAATAALRAAPNPRGVATGPRIRLHALPLLLTLAAVGVASVLSWAMWETYMGAPWTRDGTVRAYVVTMAPEVAGRIVQLPIVDNQFVHKGDLLMEIDPTDYAIAVELAEAAVTQTKVNADNAQREAARRLELNDLAVSVEQQQSYVTTASVAQAAYQQAVASLAQAKVNLGRTNIRSPVNGYVTNLLVQLGDYAKVGDQDIAIVNSDSFWVDGYFEETNLEVIHDGDPALVKLMGYKPLLRGHVAGVARGIVVANAQAGSSGLANVNPIFTWVRLAQRIPVRIQIDEVPEGLRLVAGMTASVQIEKRQRATGASRSAP